MTVRFVKHRIVLPLAQLLRVILWTLQESIWVNRALHPHLHPFFTVLIRPLGRNMIMSSRMSP